MKYKNDVKKSSLRMHKIVLAKCIWSQQHFKWKKAMNWHKTECERQRYQQ